MTRSEAKASNLRYYQGRDCGKGHIERYVSTGACVECAKSRSKERKKAHTLMGIKVTRDGDQLTIMAPLGMTITLITNQKETRSK